MPSWSDLTGCFSYLNNLFVVRFRKVSQNAVMDVLHQQKTNVPCQNAQVVSNWFQEDENEFSVLQWPLYSSDLNPIKQLSRCGRTGDCVQFSYVNLDQILNVNKMKWGKMHVLNLFKRLVSVYAIKSRSLLLDNVPRFWFVSYFSATTVSVPFIQIYDWLQPEKVH